MDNKNQGQQQGRRPGEEQFEPNQGANKEPAEGSPREPGRGQGQNPAQQPGGVTNRPMDPDEEQKDVPPRGQTKDEQRKA